MSYIKARTENGVRFGAPLGSRADYQRAIRFLEQEMSMLSQPNQSNAKPKRQTISKPRGGDDS